MSVSDLIRRMAAAGAPAEAIALAVEAIEVERSKIADAKSKKAAQKRKERALMCEIDVAMSRDNIATVARQSEDNEATISDSEATSGDIENPVSPLKEAPHTPKETNPPSENTGEGRVRSQRGTRLRPDWKPCDAGRQFAVETLGSNRAAHEQLATFIDFWAAKAGADARKLDWEATWRNWVRSAAKRPASRAGPNVVNHPARGGSITEALEKQMERLSIGDKFDFGPIPVLHGNRNPARPSADGLLPERRRDQS